MGVSTAQLVASFVSSSAPASQHHLRMGSVLRVCHHGDDSELCEWRFSLELSWANSDADVFSSDERPDLGSDSRRLFGW